MTDADTPGTAVLGPPALTDTTRSVGAMSVLTAVSRLTGFLRLTVVTGVLGTTYLANTYETANTVPNVLFELLAAGALQAVLIPTMVGLVDHSDRDEAEHVAGAVLGLTCTLLAAVAAAAAVVAPQIMGVLFGGVRDAELRAAEIHLGTFFLWFFLPQVVMYGANVVATAVLNAQHRFSLPVFAPTLNNVVVIATYLVFGWMRHGETLDLSLTVPEKLVLAGGTTLGVVVFCGVTVFAAARGFRLRPNLDHRHPVVRRLAREGGWAAIYLALTQVLLVVLLQISNRREGAVAVYNMAWAVYLLPHSLFSVPVLTTRFPILTRQARDDDWAGYSDTLGRGIRSITFLTLPATFLLIALAEPVIRLVVHGRAAHRVGEIADATVGFAPGILGFGLFLFFTRAAYAQRDAKTPTLVNALVAAVGSALMFPIAAAVTGRQLVTGLGASYAGAQLLGAVVLGAVVLRRLHARGQGLSSHIAPVLRNLAAALAAGAVAWAVSRGVDLRGTVGAGVEVLAGAVAGAAVFLVLQSLLGGPRPVVALRTLGTADRGRAAVAGAAR
jgi:putative peptidoglycan lipid II flippase